MESIGDMNRVNFKVCDPTETQCSKKDVSHQKRYLTKRLAMKARKRIENLADAW
jgi:hypothetical protein